MKTKSQTLPEVLAHLQSCRPVVQPNPGYAEQLEIYSQSGCAVTRDNVLYTKWRNRRDEIIAQSPARFSGGVRGDDLVKRRNEEKANKYQNMNLIVDGVWLGE
jgi:hypothetical protein